MRLIARNVCGYSALIAFVFFSDGLCPGDSCLGSEYLTSRNVSPRYYALFMFGDGSMLLVAVPALFHRLQWGGPVPQYV